jgi:hypothetical protein
MQVYPMRRIVHAKLSEVRPLIRPRNEPRASASGFLLPFLRGSAAILSCPSTRVFQPHHTSFSQISNLKFPISILGSPSKLPHPHQNLLRMTSSARYLRVIHKIPLAHPLRRVTLGACFPHPHIQARPSRSRTETRHLPTPLSPRSSTPRSSRQSSAPSTSCNW